jgi:GNAT superfamily N-acetyltransferase
VARLELRPFREDDLDGAARLLAVRHARHRAVEPLLPEEDARAGVEAAWGRASSGAVALRAGEPVAYVLGRPAENAIWGRHVFVDRAGHAAAEPEAARDAYALAAEAWAADGRLRHFALVPAVEAELDPWYRLAFGQMQLDGIRECGGATAHEAPSGVVIRRGGPPDLDAIALPLANLIWEHQALAPAFTGLTPPSPAETRADWQETLEAEDVTYFVAEEDGRPLGHSVLYPPDPDFGVPRGAIKLAATATPPAERGRGIGLALWEHVLAWTAEAGYASVVTDWRVPNLLASRFWPERGFRPTFHRLSRQLGTG